MNDNAKSGGNSRRRAALALARWLATKEFPSGMLGDGPERAFAQDLAYTAIRRLRPLRKILGLFAKTWPKGELEALLYIGAAQLLYMDEVPDFAAVSETVEAAKMCANPSVARVVNGVLRNMIRRRAEIDAALATMSLAERESFPGAIVRRWIARFGEENAQKLCVWHNTPAETFLAYPGGRFVKLERGRKVSEVDGYRRGEFIVQDPATALATRLVDAQPGEKILDACAAPGGKCVQLAWRGAEVTACEVNPRRRRTLEENLARLSLAGVKTTGSLDFDGSFDKVLADVPCSNTGVFRRRPDARWNWSEEKLAALAKLQAQILDQTARLVGPGGSLVYSTCSNEPEENRMQIDAFLARHPEFALAGDCESLPFESGHDGAYAARLDKIRA
ncbi:MAG: hypothetical protein ILO34_06995 [Kiritimatiellae bacterium]|nr:hypothetical protein [Kiritimatiellia bacterium]